MQQANTIQLAPKASSVMNRIIRLFCNSRYSVPQSDQALSSIEWPDSNLEHDSKQPHHGSYKQPISGGYNEAFIVQCWASYHLR
jgi:hypothetical protein